jgi:hypothetical protein
MARKLGSGDTWKVPGLYESIRERYEREAQADPRAAMAEGLDPAERERLSETSPAVTQARRVLAAMDRAEPVEDGRPSLRRFPAAREVPWLADLYSGVTRVLVEADDTVTPAANCLLPIQ